MQLLCHFVLTLFLTLHSSDGAVDDVKNRELVTNPARPSRPVNELQVIQLTSRNVGTYLSDGNVWLVEFYSPNCVHCVEFATTYADIARHYHGSDTHKIKVAKVNGEVERALVSRFGIYAYPSFYIVDGWSVYHFQQPRLKNVLKSFAEGGYKQSGSIPFYTSPMGPLGLTQGLLMSAGHNLSDFFQWSQRTFGLSPRIVGMVLFGSMFLGCFFVIVFLAVVIPPRKKRD